MKLILFVVFEFFVLAGLFAQTDSTYSINVATTSASCQKGSVTLTITGGTGPVTVNWNNGAQGTYLSGLDSGIYQATISDSLENDTILSVHIPAEVCPIVVSNNFSPNNDNINDEWIIHGSQLYSEYLVQVYNRWGQKVFEAKSDFVSWDGKFLGAPVPDGTYYYIIEFSDKYFGKQIKNGSITLLR